MDRRTAIKNLALSLGVAVSGSTVISLFNACTSDKNTVQPEFFALEDFNNIDFISDIILPASSSIGAKDLNMATFIDSMCQHVFHKDKQQSLRLGAKAYSQRFETTIGKPSSDGNTSDHEVMVARYFDIPEAKEKAAFELIQKDAVSLSEKEKPDYYLYTFLTTIRELTLFGYFTAQTVMEREKEA